MISLLLPSRGRPENIARLHASVVETISSPWWEMVVRLDDDDPKADEYPTLPSVRYLRGQRGVLSTLWNDCYAEAGQADTYMHCGDDITFSTPGWDRIVLDAFPEDGIAFVHGDDASDHGSWFGTHGFLRREWIDALGYFVPPYFSSDYNDTWHNEIANMLGRRIFVPIVTEHFHPAFGKAEWDQTHQERLARGREDNVDLMYREKAHERFLCAMKLYGRMRP